MSGSASLILYTARRIEQDYHVLRFAVRIFDFHRKQWWVDQWFHTALFIHYTGLLTTTTSLNSVTKYSAIWRLLQACEYMHEWWYNILLHALSNRLKNEFCNNTSRQNNSQPTSAFHCTRVSMRKISNSEIDTSQLRSNIFTNLISWIIGIL